MAVRGRGSALVLVTPYTSIPDVADRLVRSWLPVRYLMRERFDTLAKAPRIAIPALVLHGTDDEIVPYALGQRVASALPHGRLITVVGGHHNDLFLGDTGFRFFAEIAEFVRRARPATSAKDQH
jgi:pimeloyl-ACP methyl ester carboxylesterase